MAFSANFGGKPSKAPGKNDWPGRLTVFACLLAGTVMFMSYRASITSVLAIRKYPLPFATPQEMLKTDYKYACCKLLETIITMLLF